MTTVAASPYAGVTPVASLAHAEGAVTLVEGQTFAVSGRIGDMQTDLPQGLFVLDTRVLSKWELRVNGNRLEPLTVDLLEPFAARFAGRTAPAAGRADADLVVFRVRHVSRGMRERIVITNHGLERVALRVELAADVDFADLFAVKESRVQRRGRHSHRVEPGSMSFGFDEGPVTKEVTVAFSHTASVEPGLANWRFQLDPGETWELCTQVSVSLAAVPIEPRFVCGGEDAIAVPTRRMHDWRAGFPGIETNHFGFARALERSATDLGALRIYDPEHPDRPILAAGAPWFMTVFGRDSLLTAWMTLIADSSLAKGVLETLAEFQGSDINPHTEEQPGKILHEMRFGGSASLALGGGDIYYGTVDATPLFVMLLGELRHWDPRDDLVERLLPHADRALEWIETFGDRDGDGYVEYQRATDRGLANQGWKDSWDAIRFADGRLAEPPIALCEVQGYAYAAFVARADLALDAGDTDAHEAWSTKAKALRERFNEDFWLESEGTYALALDARKRPVDAVASNVGHCLWTGIVDPERAPLVAERLLAEDMFSGFGVRTLATSMRAYNPVSYHNGSIWPHDNALCAAGLMRYGLADHAHRIIMAQLAVSAHQNGRLPELFAGFARSDLAVPAPYPTSCSPQAWAAAAPLLWLRTLLRVYPWLPEREVWMHPDLPAEISHLRVDGMQVAGATLSFTVDGDGLEVDADGDVKVHYESRPRWTPPVDGV